MIGWAAQGDFHFTIRLVKGAYWDQELIVAEPEELAFARIHRKI